MRIDTETQRDVSSYLQGLLDRLNVQATNTDDRSTENRPPALNLTIIKVVIIQDVTLAPLLPLNCR